LTATIQGAYPLPLYLLPHPVELSLAVVQPEVLIEAPQHPCEMLLLLPSPPVSVVKDPFPRASQKLPATLDARYTNQSESPCSIDPADMFEAKKLESFWSPISVAQTRNACKAPKENASCFLLSQFQPEFREPLPHFRLELVRVFPELKTHHKIISETHQIRLAPTVWPDFLLKPQIENEVKIKVAQHG
jgi:hypothetical protein